MDQEARTRPVSLAVWTLVAAGIAGALRLAWWYWPDGVFSDVTSGTWAALAWDVAHGELYRPVFSPDGYGGTRYMPLFFSLFGALIRWHVDPVRAGVLLMQVSVFAAACALYAMLRASDAPRSLALPLAGTVYATIVYQRYLTDVRADYLAAAFAAAGIAAAVVAERRAAPRWLFFASVCCACGGLTKVTTIAFAVPIAWRLWSCGERGRAVRFVSGTAVLFAIAILLVQVASGGRFLESFRAAMSAGTTPADIWRHAGPSFVQESAGNPFSGVPFLAALFCTVRAARRGHWSLAHAYFATALGVALVILVSPGTASNQLIDLHLASTLVIGLAVARGHVAPRLVASMYVLLAMVMAIVSWPVRGVPSTIRTLRAEGPHRRSVVTAVHDRYLNRARLYLSTDPMIPILSGTRPFLLDSFNLVLFVTTRTRVGADFAHRIKTHAFDAIVLHDDGVFPADMAPGDPMFDALCAKYWARDNAVIQAVHVGYEVRAVQRPFVILEPRR